MQTEVGFPETVGLKEVVKEADNTVSTLSYVHALIYEVVDLCMKEF